MAEIGRYEGPREAAGVEAWSAHCAKCTWTDSGFAVTVEEVERRAHEALDNHMARYHAEPTGPERVERTGPPP